MTGTYALLGRIVDKLSKARGLLIMANTVDLPEGIPEHEVTKRPIIDCYYSLLCSLALLVLRSTYTEEKLGRVYEYQLWAFKPKS